MLRWAMNSGNLARRHPSPAARRRSGFGLIDMISVIGLVGMLMSLSVVVLGQAYAAHRRALTHFRQMQHLQNAQHRFVQDAHRSVAVGVAGGLALTMASGEQVHYAVTDNRLIRLVTVEGEVSNQEQWQLPAACNASWNVDRSQHLPIVSCELSGTDTTHQRQPLRWLSRCELESSQSGVEAADETL